MNRAAAILLAGSLIAGDAPPATPTVNATADEAIERGLKGLKNLQTSRTGHIGSEGAGITAMAGMAFLAGGHTPTRGAYREVVAKALSAVIADQDKATGYLGGNGSGNMYSHGFATLFLAECYGLAPEMPVRRALEAAIDLIWKSQNNQGGWRYSPAPVDADLSVTICQVMALRAAYNAGIGGQRSIEVMAKAIEYVKKSHNGNGTFSYTLPAGGGGSGEGEVPRAAAGVMSLIGAGITNPTDPALGPGLRFLRSNALAHLRSTAGWGHYWYGQYYVAQAMFHSPDESDWDRYWKAAVPAIVSKQSKSSGLWTESGGGGPAFASGVALVILQIPNNYLPIFQR